ncbi:hypothetical protein [Methanolobus psychrotolerans]|uniref:hypothetical protein n=1 Tax=Methanolobus psychrotolerans TaxID=1874706 RepID=UPI00101AD44D|nr:hypothetical protein [Methanolobus psychrotolerans]
MTKGNIPLNKSLAKEIQDGNVIQELPEVIYDKKMYPLFTVISPKQCCVCGSDLNYYHRTAYLTASAIISCA